MVDLFFSPLRQPLVFIVLVAACDATPTVRQRTNDSRSHDIGSHDGAQDAGSDGSAQDSSGHDSAEDTGSHDGAYDAGTHDSADDAGSHDSGGHDSAKPDSGPIKKGCKFVLDPSGANAGVWAVWGKEAFKVNPKVKGGQIVEQWQNLEPSKGKYSFAAVEAALKAFHTASRAATIQINAGLHPSYLFAEVPYIPGVQLGDTKDPKGTLIYWSDHYIDRHRRLVVALRKWLQGLPSSLRQRVLGLRQSSLGTGTGLTAIPSQYRKASTWTVPAGVVGAVPGDFSDAIADNYQALFIKYYVDQIYGNKPSSPLVPLFVRSSGVGAMSAAHLKMLGQGQLGLYDTASRVAPYKKSFGPLDTYCHSTFCYAASASASGKQAGQYGSTREQWLYWRHIHDLALGVAFIASRGGAGVDLSRYPSSAEDRATYDFADRYAGRQCEPAAAPGAWIAFKGVTCGTSGGVDLGPCTKSWQTWGKADYGFLAKLSAGAAGTVALRRDQNGAALGPANQRQGLFARRLPAGKSLTVTFETAFVSSLSKVELVVAFLDQGQGQLKIAALGKSRSFTLGKSKTWKTKKFSITRMPGSAPTVTLQAAGAAVTLHMLELRRL